MIDTDGEFIRLRALVARVPDSKTKIWTRRGSLPHRSGGRTLPA